MCKTGHWIRSKFGVEQPSPKVRQFPLRALPTSHETLIEAIAPAGSQLMAISNTNSMDPLFDDGHTLLVQPITNYSDLIVGDMVVYDIGYGLIAHRICEIYLEHEEWRYRVWGDNNGNKDSVILAASHLKYLIIGIFYFKSEAS